MLPCILKNARVAEPTNTCYNLGNMLPWTAVGVNFNKSAPGGLSRAGFHRHIEFSMHTLSIVHFQSPNDTATSKIHVENCMLGAQLSCVFVRVISCFDLENLWRKCKLHLSRCVCYVQSVKLKFLTNFVLLCNVTTN